MSTISASTTSTTAYKVSADTTGTLVLQTGSSPTTAATFDANQNMGLGVTPSAWATTSRAFQWGANSILENNNSAATYIGFNGYRSATGWKYITSSYAQLYGAENDGGFKWYQAASGTAGNAISFTQAMTLDASGRLLVGGTTAPTGSAILLLNSNNGVQLATTVSGGGNITPISGGGLQFFNYTGAVGSESYSEKARIDSSGNLLVGTTNANPNAGAGVKMVNDGTDGAVAVVGATSTNSNVTYRLYSTGAGAYRFYVGYGGTINATSTTITGISDQRLKENIRDLDDGLEKVMALQPRKFDWKEGKGKGIANDRGFIAQEFEQVFPDMIEQWMDEPPEGEEPYKAVNANLIPTLVKAIQEQQAIIETLTNRITALEAK